MYMKHTFRMFDHTTNERCRYVLERFDARTLFQSGDVGSTPSL